MLPAFPEPRLIVPIEEYRKRGEIGEVPITLIWFCVAIFILPPAPSPKELERMKLKSLTVKFSAEIEIFAP